MGEFRRVLESWWDVALSLPIGPCGVMGSAPACKLEVSGGVKGFIST